MPSQPALVTTSGWSYARPSYPVESGLSFAVEDSARQGGAGLSIVIRYINTVKMVDDVWLFILFTPH